MKLIITVEGNHNDIEFIRSRAVSAVKEFVNDEADEGKFDDNVEVEWEIED